MSSAACYRPIAPFKDKRRLNFRFSPTMVDRPSPWPEGKWVNEIQHMAKGAFDSASQSQMKAQWAIINPILKELPDVIGQFRYLEMQFPALRKELKEAIEAVDPGLCSFVPIEQLYNERHERRISEPQYFFTAVRNHKDSLDLEAGETTTIYRPDGSPIETLLPSSRIRPEALDGAMLWRDEKSQEVLCDERFKSLAEKVGCVGMYFLEMKLSESKC